jgi:hypothetical protein
MQKWKWLFVKAFQCKTSVSAATEFLTRAGMGTNESMCSVSVQNLYFSALNGIRVMLQYFLFNVHYLEYLLIEHNFYIVKAKVTQLHARVRVC